MHCVWRSGLPMRDLLRSSCVRAAAATLITASALHAQSPRLDARSITAWADLLAVHDARRADTTVIDSALRSRVVPLRAAAIRVVGMNRIVARYGAVRALMLSSPDTTIQRDAAFALGVGADAASCAALQQMLTRPAAGEAAAWALGELNVRCSAFGPLLDSVARPQTRAALLRVAGKWTPFPDSAVSNAYSRASRDDERWAALYALARSRRPAGAAFALSASRHPAPRMRELAARLLAQPLQSGATQDSALSRTLVLLRDPDAHVRIAAVRSAATYRNVALTALERAWTAERNANVRVALVQSLAGVVEPGASTWSSWWSTDTTIAVRLQLVASAWQANAIDALAAGATVPLATHPEPRIRVAMIDGAAALDVEKYAPAFALRLADGDARVRVAAFDALVRATPTTQSTLRWDDILAVARRDSAMRMRESVMRYVSRTARSEDVASAIAEYRSMARDASREAREAREAVLTIIANAWRRDSTNFADSTIARLRAFDPPSDSLDRIRGGRITPLTHWRRATDTSAMSHDVYERIVRTIVQPSLAGKPPALLVATERGPIRITLDGVRAPMTSDHFLRLSRSGYFRGMRFHRVVPAFVAQGGDPRGDGTGGPGYAIRDELGRSPYVRGAVGMALSGPDTGGSQFFLTLSPQPHLEGRYAVFGHVTSGLAAMDALVQGHLLRDITPRLP